MMIKVGVEVEGKFKGLPSIFINSKEEFKAIVENIDLVKQNYSQVYISDANSDWVHQVGSYIKELIVYQGVVVTIQSEQLNSILKNDQYMKLGSRLHLMLDISNGVKTPISQLRPTDSVKVHDSVTGEVFVISVENFFVTDSSDFTDDYHIELPDNKDIKND